LILPLLKTTANGKAAFPSLVYLWSFFVLIFGRNRWLGGLLALLLLVLAIIGLLRTPYLMKAFGVTVEVPGWFGRKKQAVKLGAPKPIQRAEDVSAQKKTTVQRRVDEANGKLSLVFDPASMRTRANHDRALGASDVRVNRA
jgi:hypothetical protein